MPEILLGREQMRAEAAEQIARAIFCDDPVQLKLPRTYGKEPRGHRMRDGHLAGVLVDVHSDPRVQKIVERTRERGMCQAIDRLRLIHGRPGREIFILCDIPLPGIVVDEYLSLREILDGGSRAQRAFRETGILPTNGPDLAAAIRASGRALPPRPRG